MLILNACADDSMSVQDFLFQTAEWMHFENINNGVGVTPFWKDVFVSTSEVILM